MSKVTKDDFKRVDNDSNGNPRYAISYYHLLTPEEKNGSVDSQYELALKKAKKLGGKKFNNKQFGGGIVFQSYNINTEVERINEMNGSKNEKKEAPKKGKSSSEVMSDLKSKKDSKKKKSAAENYYERELSYVDLNSEYAPKVKIRGGEKGETKTLDINKESAPILVDWLESNFGGKKSSKNSSEVKNIIYLMPLDGYGKYGYLESKKWSGYKINSEGKLSVVWPSDTDSDKKIKEEGFHVEIEKNESLPKFYFKGGITDVVNTLSKLPRYKDVEFYTIGGFHPSLKEAY